MTNHASAAEENEDAFSLARFIAPYLLLVVANAGAAKAPVDDRPVLFWTFAAVGAMGALATISRLKLMTRTHRLRPLPGWTRFLGGLLAVYCLYVAYQVVDGMAP